MDNSWEADVREEVEAACIERRSAVRHPCNLEATCQAIGGTQEGTWVGKILDISSVGLGLLLPLPLDRGTILVLDLPAFAGSELESLSACVMHSRSHPDGGIFTGCVFAEPLHEDQLQTLLKQSRP